MSTSRVVMVRAKNAMTEEGTPDPRRVRRALEVGLTALTGSSGPAEALRRLFRPQDKVGIKVNTIAGPNMSTLPGASLPLAEMLLEGRPSVRGVLIWDRTNRELREAGYRLNLALPGPLVLGTDTEGFGYEQELVSHENIGSLFSTVLTRNITASVSLARLKDHGLAGVTAGLKNYFGAVHNPNKYHDTHCDPYVAELFQTAEVSSRHRLSILDALQVQFHRGPSYHPAWTAKLETLVLSLDPVAADSVGHGIIERLRSGAGLPSLREEEREPSYLKTAARLGLGRSEDKDIALVEVEA